MFKSVFRRRSMLPARAARVRTAPLFLVALSATLGACTGADRIITNKIEPDDIRVRHPLEIAQTTKTLDVIIVSRNAELDPRSYRQIREFGAAYNMSGKGDIAVMLPQGSAAGQTSVPAIRRALAAGGAHGYVSISSYPVLNPQLASPVRLAFSTISARTTHACGQWPNDLASGSSLQTWENHSYWNFGCATQQNLAAQISDPRDLLGPQAITPPDAQMRVRAISHVREGTDPTTKWGLNNTN